MADYSMTRDHESEGIKPGWQNMEEMSKRGRTTMTVDRGENPGRANIIEAMEQCFQVADELAATVSGIEERLGFILAMDVDSLEKSPTGSLDGDGALAPMIGRLNDLERKLRTTRNRLARTSERIAI